MDDIDIAQKLFKRETVKQQTTTATAMARSDSAGGTVVVYLDGEEMTVPTTCAVVAGDSVQVTIVSNSPTVTGVVGGGDRTKGIVSMAQTTAIEAAKTAKDAATITITSTHGSVFKDNAITTSLNVSVFQPGGTRIETQAALEAAFGHTARIEWRWRKNTDGEWRTIVSTDSRLSNNGFSLAITPEDVDERTSFEATMETD